MYYYYLWYGRQRVSWKPSCLTHVWGKNICIWYRVVVDREKAHEAFCAPLSYSLSQRVCSSADDLINKQRRVDSQDVYLAYIRSFSTSFRQTPATRPPGFVSLEVLSLAPFISLFLPSFLTCRRKKTKWLQVVMKIRAIHHYLLGMKKIHNNVI